jgi:hypothetical protein
MENISFIKGSKESNDLLIRTLFSTWTCTIDTFNVEHPVQAAISTTLSTILRSLAVAHHALIIIINEKHKKTRVFFKISASTQVARSTKIYFVEWFKVV